MNKLVLLIALIPSISHSQCEIDGVNVIYREVSNTRLHGSVAQAYIRNGNYIIEYSDKVNGFPKILKDHIMAHECAHHKLKHTTKPNIYGYSSYEMDADCFAIKQLNWSNIEVEQLIDSWRTIFNTDSRGETIKKCLSQN